METQKYRYLLSFALVILVIVGSCNKSNNGVSSLYTPTSADVTATATLQDLQQGRTLFINNCNACHSLYSPDDYTPTQWKSIINTMGTRTSLSASEISLVTKYVTRGKQ
jgi:mono/diheme cytochrome c family protein